MVYSNGQGIVLRLDAVQAQMKQVNSACDKERMKMTQ